MLGDRLQQMLPSFYLTKIVVPPNEWASYSEKIARERGWPQMPSPIIWRELVDTGGRVTLIGDARDFQEYASTYYDQLSKLSSYKLLHITTDNQRFTDATISSREIKQLMRNTWRKITIIGSESSTAARLSLLLAMMPYRINGRKMKLILFPGNILNLQAVEMLKETLDESACTGLNIVEVSTNLTDALEDASLVIILDVVARKPSIFVDGVWKHSETRAEWLERRFNFFYRLGECIRQSADQNVRVLVAGSQQVFEGSEAVASPLNFDVQTLHMACKDSIALNNIVGLPRALEYSMKAALASQLGLHRNDIVDLIIWGNIDNLFLVDVSQARAYRRHGPLDSEVGPAWFSLAAEPLIYDVNEFYEKIIPEKLGKVRPLGKNAAAMCHASAIFNFIKQWQFGYKDPHETITSLIISSKGQYNVPAGLAFSFPVITSPMGCFEVCQNIAADLPKMQSITKCVLDALKDWSIVNPSMLLEFRKTSEFLTRPLSQSGVRTDLTNTVTDLDISSEPTDQNKRVVIAVMDSQKATKN